MMFNNFPLSKAVAIAFVIFSVGISHSQIIGGRDNSEMTPQVASPSELSGGGFTGDVNVMTGEYQASVDLGSVSTPGGLNYNLSLNYNSSFSFSQSQPMTAGMPYGEGWSLNIPTISIETDVFHKFTCGELNSDGGPNGTQGLINFNDGTDFSAKDEGDLYWFAPMINIPGVISGKAIFKYVDVSDENCLVFVLNKFESPAEIRYYGEEWTLKLADGTDYLFSKHLANYRAPSNQRSIFYDQSSQNPSNFMEGNFNTDNATYGTLSDGIQNVVEPKMSYSVWYCTKISNENLYGQLIHFEFKEYGKFNYFKEFLQEGYSSVLTNVFNSATLENLKDYEACTDIILKSVRSEVLDSHVDVLELEYDNLNEAYTNPAYLNPNLSENIPVDELYTSTVVHKWGGTNDFDDWLRFKHVKASSSGLLNGINSSNPFQDANGNYYIEDVPNGSNEIDFDHSFLESPRIFNGENIFPGSLYEIRTKITRDNGQNLNDGNGILDFALVTGPNTGLYFDPQASSEATFTPSEFQATRSIEVFSTFNMAMKWQMSYGQTELVTSNMFMMPNVPTTYNGFNLQIGPGNSDIDFASSYPDNIDLVDSNIPNASSAYPFHDFAGRNIPSTARIPNNFGTGHPWSMMIPVFNEMALQTSNVLGGSVGTPLDLYKTWWYDSNNQAGTSFPNTPTKFSNGVHLNEVELIRYSKNPYVLQGVKKYKVNGEYVGLESTNNPGLKLVSEKTLEYDVKHDQQNIRNYDYQNGDPIEFETQLMLRTVFLLTKVREIPVDQLTATDTSEVLTTFFGYEKYLDASQATNVVFDDTKPYQGINQYILNSYLDQLGGYTEVKYYPVDSDVTRIQNNYLKEYCNLAISSPDPAWSVQKSYTVHPVVNKILKNDENDYVLNGNAPNGSLLKEWEYVYDLDSTISHFSQYVVNPQYFRSNYRRNLDLAFGKVTIYDPEIEVGERTYTEYIHYGHNGYDLTQIYDINNSPQFESIEDYLFYGKPKAIRKFDANGVIHSETLINYDYTLAFINGHERPNFLREQLGYDDLMLRSYEYKDIYFNDLLTVDVTVNNSTTTYSGQLAYPFVTVPYLNGNYSEDEMPKLLEFYFYNDLRSINPEHFFHSYFVKKTEEINRVYDNSLEKANNLSIAPPIVVEDKSTNPHGTGKTNPRINDPVTDQPLKNAITTSKEQSKQLLIDSSPLSDSVLIVLIETNGISSRTKCDVLSFQGGCSNEVWKKIIDNINAFAPVDLQKVVQSQAYFSDEVQLHLIKNVSKSVDTRTYESILTKNQYLTDPVVKELTKSENEIPGESFSNVLEKESQFSDSMLVAIISSDQLKGNNLSRTLENQLLSDQRFTQILNDSKFKQEEITRLFERTKSYPSDDILVEVLNRLPKFNVRAIERILKVADREIGNDVLSLIDLKYNQKEAALIKPKPFQGNTLNKFCRNEVIEGRKFIETKTEYEYYEADYRGFAIGKAYELLQGHISDVNESSTFPKTATFGSTQLNLEGLRLKHEPSWQVFAVKTSSPQHPGAYDRQEYFYYYDLQNRYDRYWYNYDLSDPSMYVEDFIADPSTGNIIDTLFVNANWDQEYWGGGIYPTLPKFDGMERSRTHGNRVLTFQKATISKNSRDAKPLIRSEYYHYDKRWLFDDLPVYETIEYADGNCPPAPPTDPCDNIEDCTDCFSFKYTTDEAMYAQTPFGYCAYAIPGLGGYICPIDDDISTLYPDAVVLFCNTVFDNDQKAQLPQDLLSRTLQLRDVTVQVDTLDHSKNKDFESLKLDENNSYVAEFYMGPTSATDANNFPAPYRMIFPFDHLTVRTVLERNRYLQPELEENQVGLQTKYYYDRAEKFWNVLVNCPPESNYTSTSNTNIGLPNRICVGFNKTDSLSTAYEYNDVGLPIKVAEPSGKYTDYTFDGYHRLLTVTENGSRNISEMEYSNWDHDNNLAFDQRTEFNFVQTKLFNSGDGSTLDYEIRKGFVDPNGREHSLVSAYWDNNNVLQQIHSGTKVFDNWNRVKRNFKSYVVTPVDNVIRPTINYTFELIDQVYENDPKSRLLRSSDFGGYNVYSNFVKRSKYAITNNVYTSCELSLNADELELIMGPGSTVNYCFYRTEFLDQDSKMKVEYLNAIGQKVASLGYNDGGEKIVTLFVYDSYGNLTQVINPEKQRSTYKYNILGQLTKEITVDAGEKHYMYNKQGLVSAIQDQVSLTHEENNLLEPYYRTFTYDDFGRPTGIGRTPAAGNPAEVFDGMFYGPLHYETTFIGDDIDDPITIGGNSFYFDYVYSNASTQDWLISYESFGVAPAGAINEIVHINGLSNSNYLAPIYLEKKFHYGNDPINDPLRVGKLTQSRSYNNNNVNIQKVSSTYDQNGNLSLQTIRFNPTQDVDLNTGNLISTINYPYYNNRNSLLEEYVDVNGDGTTDLHYFMVYDRLNRLNSIYAAAGYASTLNEATKIVSYEYNDAFGLVTKKEHSLDDQGSNKVVNEVTYQYDMRDRLTNIQAGQMSKGLNPIMDYQLFYDNAAPSYLDGTTTEFVDHDQNFNGNINGTLMSYNFNGTDIVTQVSEFDKPTLYGYEYDKINRLIHADATVGDFALQTGNQQQIMNSYMIGDLEIAYDRIGNIQSLLRTLRNTDASQGAPYTMTDDYNYNYQVSTNRLLSVNAGPGSLRQYAYDLNGNLLSDTYKGVTTTDYGRASYPFEVEMSNNNIDTDIEYLYSVQDQRCYKKVVETDNNGAVISTSEDYYLMDATGKTIAIQSKTTTSSHWEYYVSGSEREARLIPTAYQAPGNNTGGIRFEKEQVTYFLYDHLGNTRVTYSTRSFTVSDVAQNEIGIVSDYFPFGKILREFHNGEEERFLTTQHERDKATGLDYRGARYYDGDLGRFLSTDPWQDKYPEWSTYNYVMGNPIIFTDPTGKGVDGDYFDSKGNYLGSDGVDDGKIYVLSEKRRAKVENTNINWEGTLDDKTISELKKYSTMYPEIPSKLAVGVAIEAFMIEQAAALTAKEMGTVAPKALKVLSKTAGAASGGFGAVENGYQVYKDVSSGQVSGQTWLDGVQAGGYAVGTGMLFSPAAPAGAVVLIVVGASDLLELLWSDD